MAKLEATHFIEQFNSIRQHAEGDQKENFTPTMPIGDLEKQLRSTEKYMTLRTVAVFKIKFKSPLK